MLVTRGKLLTSRYMYNNYQNYHILLILSLLHYKVALRDLARIHSSFLAKQQWLTSQYWLDVESVERMTRMQPLWVAMLQNAEKKFPEMWSKE